MTRRISRRTVLKGLGTTLALPFLDIMGPSTVLGGTTPSGAPRRMLFFYVPNGAWMPDWTPKETGHNFELPYILEPLKDFRQDFSVLSGLTLDKARANGDGAGDHARANAAFLTGRQPRKTAGADIKVGISVDQFAAQRIGEATRFPSLELGCEPGAQAGNCDSGYSCAYSANLSWRTESTPQPKIVDPKTLFDRMFSSDNKAEAAEARAKRALYRKSVLDFVRDDAASLRKDLGATDQRKLDEYLEGVREVEGRITRAASEHAKELPKPTMPRPLGIPREYRDHLRLLADMLTLALQTDQTRIAVFSFANDGSNRPYPVIGVREGHHDLSHHGRNPDKTNKIRKINRFHIEQFAYFLGKLKAIKEGQGTLLDNCMIVYGSGIGDGDRHNHDDLPILFAGKGGGLFNPGQHRQYPRETPLMNLYLTMLDAMGIKARSFGDSTGRLTGL